jgi:predicted esterase
MERVKIGLIVGLAACRGPSEPADSDDVPADTDVVDSDTAPPEWCPEADRAVPLQDVTTTPASPWFVHHPEPEATGPPTVVFLPGGPGDRNSAAFGYEGWLREGNVGFRIVVLYASDGDLTDEYERTTEAVAEVLACFGGDAAAVHLAGTSNGGVGAYELMLSDPEPYASLLGAPGAWQDASDAALIEALTGRPVYNAVGELDASWKPYVEDAHDRLVGLGLDSTYAELEGQGHVLEPAFDESRFFEFWRGVR